MRKMTFIAVCPFEVGDFVQYNEYGIVHIKKITDILCVQSAATEGTSFYLIFEDDSCVRADHVRMYRQNDEL